MVKIIWTDRSLIDIEDIAEFIEKDSIKYARLTVEKIFLKASLLENQPLAGRVVPEINDDKIREIIVGNYRIIYEYKETVINILTVHHAMRDLKKRRIF